MPETEHINAFGKTNFRGREVPFGIKPDDRRRHMYVVGKTGMGKTALMENMAIQDIRNGHGVAFLDPHGDSVQRILDCVPANRVNDVIYFNPADLEFPISFNILEAVDVKFKHLVASGLMGVFTKIWAGVWSARMEYILMNTILALLDSPGNTMLGITRMYTDKKYRKKIVDNIKDPMVRAFWVDEFANYQEKYRTEAVAPIQNKVGQFLSSAIVRNIVGQPKSTMDVREIMDKKQILIMDLSKGKVGEDNSALLGAMIVTKIQLAAMSRTDIPEEERKDFYLYVDEFQNFATDSFATILSEARKYRLNLIVGHQYISQLEQDKSTKVRDAIFGNVGTMVIFRIGAADAEFMETEFAPNFTPEDLVNLPKYHIILKLMINGVASAPFSAVTLAPNAAYLAGNRNKVIKVSRERYGNPVADVEDKISRWMGEEIGEGSRFLATEDEAADESPLFAPPAAAQPKTMTMAAAAPRAAAPAPRPAPAPVFEQLLDPLPAPAEQPLFAPTPEMPELPAGPETELLPAAPSPADTLEFAMQPAVVAPTMAYVPEPVAVAAPVQQMAQAPRQPEPRRDDRPPRRDDRPPRQDNGPRRDDRGPRRDFPPRPGQGSGPRRDDRGPRPSGPGGSRFGQRASGPRRDDRGPKKDKPQNPIWDLVNQMSSGGKSAFNQKPAAPTPAEPTQSQPDLEQF